MIRPLIAAASAFGLVLAAQGAVASPARTGVAVDHADLDLSTVQGQRELDRRIEVAARRVCTVEARTGTIVKRLDRNCYETAMRSARQNVAVADASPASGR